MKNMEGAGFSRTTRDSGDYYLKLPLAEYAQLPEEELEKAAEAMGITVERLLSMTEKAQEEKKKYQEVVQAVEMPTKTNLQMILERIDLSLSLELADIEREEAARCEAEAFDLIDKLSNTRLTWEQRKALLKKITKNFVPSLRVQFIDNYNLFRQEVSDEEAFVAADAKFTQDRLTRRQNMPEIDNAFFVVMDEMKTRHWFMTARSQYLDDPRKMADQDFQLLNKIKQAAYRGFNGDRVTREMRANVPTGYMQKIPGLVYEEARTMGISSVHNGSGPTGPSEVYGGVTPNAFSRQNRPRRSNDGLEPF